MDQQKSIDGGPVAGAETPPTQKPTNHQQQRRVADYLEVAAKIEEPFEALVNIMEGGLVQQAMWLHEDLHDVRQSEEDPLNRLDAVVTATEATYKLTKMIHTYAKVVRRMKRERLEPQANQPDRDERSPKRQKAVVRRPK